MDRQALKESLISAIEVVREVQKETGIAIGTEDIAKIAISVFIQSSRGNGNGAGTAKPDSQKPANGNGGTSNGNGKGNGGAPATDPQMNFLKKYGGKNLILAGLSKQKAFELIQGIKANWK